MVDSDRRRHLKVGGYAAGGIVYCRYIHRFTYLAPSSRKVRYQLLQLLPLSVRKAEERRCQDRSQLRNIAVYCEVH